MEKLLVEKGMEIVRLEEEIVGGKEVLVDFREIKIKDDRKYE